MADIHRMALTGESVVEPMRSRKPVVSWDDILIRGAQLARLPLNRDETIDTKTVIGPRAKKPLVIGTPIIVSHMSFGALSREAQMALALGSGAAGTAMSSGEGGILPEAMKMAHKYIFEYVPNRYSVTPENLERVDAVEIKFGQSAKPGMGGHLPGAKVTAEIAAVRGLREGADIVSPSRFPDIATRGDLKRKVDELRRLSKGRPIGIKFAAGHVEADLEFALSAGPDFITIDGRAGATGAAVKLIKDATSVPTIYALDRARRYLEARGIKDVTLIVDRRPARLAGFRQGPGPRRGRRGRRHRGPDGHRLPAVPDLRHRTLSRRHRHPGPRAAGPARRRRSGARAGQFPPRLDRGAQGFRPAHRERQRPQALGPRPGHDELRDLGVHLDRARLRIPFRPPPSFLT